MTLHLVLGSALSREHSVFLDFDSSIIGRDYAGVPDWHRQCRALQVTLKVTRQGNDDERGGSEYSLALGQLRAEAVKSALKLTGPRQLRLKRSVSTRRSPSSWVSTRQRDAKTGARTSSI